MKLSQRGEYALRALLVLGMNHGPAVVRIRDIAQQQNIPRRFLEQILNDLKAAGFVVSKRGGAGGSRAAARAGGNFAGGHHPAPGRAAGAGGVRECELLPALFLPGRGQVRIRSVMQEVRDAIVAFWRG
ncbi:MAG: hypothetical protein CM1200mP34_1580 [Verrucomicrobiales bacterium]|nr:MAG: hypothetical protein CM1200mP34_1580 [Verrucomicrobiales bacterium]